MDTDDPDLAAAGGLDAERDAPLRWLARIASGDGWSSLPCTLGTQQVELPQLFRRVRRFRV